MDRAARRRLAREGKTTDPVTALWLSNAMFAPTGYGTQTRQVVTRMIADGHHVTVAANYGLQAVPMDVSGVKHLPQGLDPHNNDVAKAYFQAVTSEHPGSRSALFTLYDTWVFKPESFEGLPVFSWVPVDHVPVPPAVLAWCALPNVTPIAMSRFGQAALAAEGVASVYIPHGIDTDLFKPTPTVETAAGVKTSREIIGVSEDRFVVGIVNANKANGHTHRKAFFEQLMAFRMFAETHPDAYLYLHTDATPNMGGADFTKLLKLVGLREGQYGFVNQYQYRMGVPEGILAAIYSGMDVLLSPTYSEGFGLTTIEAQACGTPVIVQDFTAQPEMVGDGWLVTGQPLYDMTQDACFSVPSIPDIVRALNESYARKGSGPSEAARRHVVDNYNADDAYVTYWRPLLESL